MIDRPRKVGALDASAPVRDSLARLRGAAGIEAAPEIDADRVREVEAAFGSHLPDDVLAVFASGVPALAEQHAMTIGNVVGHTGSLREAGAPGDLIGVGKLGRREVLCARKNATGSQLVRFDLDDKSTEPLDLAAWLRELAPDAPPAPFEPRLIAFQPESTLAGRRVRHKVFGEGRALSETGTGPTRKVKCDFPGRGLKLLQARFLEFLD